MQFQEEFKIYKKIFRPYLIHKLLYFHLISSLEDH